MKRDNLLQKMAANQVTLEMNAKPMISEREKREAAQKTHRELIAKEKAEREAADQIEDFIWGE